MSDDNQSHSADTDPPSPAKPPRRRDILGDSGCLVLVLIGLPFFNLAGFLVSTAGRYGPAMHLTSLSGFACGAALGAYVSVRILQQPWWSSCRWAIYGIFGMCLPVFGIFTVTNLFLSS